MQEPSTDLVPGPQRPLEQRSTLPRGGARRTTTIDTRRPDGPVGPAVVTLTGRDATVDDDDVVTAVATAELQVGVSPAGVVTDIEGDLPTGAAGALVGASLRAGFGRLVGSVLEDELGARGLVGSLIEDLSGAYFVSGTVLLLAGQHGVAEHGLDLVGDMQADVCAGWKRGDQQHRHLMRHAELAVPEGATVVDLADRPDADGVDGWHALTPLGPNSHRRARLLDLAPGVDGRAFRAHFRDSVVADTGTERAIHEYGLSGAVDGDGVIASLDVEARVLPWVECPAALASGQRVVGERLDALPAMVRGELVGTTTCTHLNATLRSLADGVALLALIG